MTGFPRWAKDLRRFEIVAFGTLPFTALASDIALGQIPGIDKEPGTVFLFAATASVSLAVVDLVIVFIKRGIQAKRQRRHAIPQGEPIIIRTPWPPLDDQGPPEADLSTPGQIGR